MTIQCNRCGGTGTYELPTTITRPYQWEDGMVTEHPWCFKCDGKGTVEYTKKQEKKMTELTEDEQLGYLEIDTRDPDFKAKLENIKLDLAREAGIPEHVLYEDDVSPELDKGKELTEDEFLTLDTYYTTKWSKDSSKEQAAWVKLRDMRHQALQDAIEATEWVWLPLDAFDAKVSSRLLQVEPTDEQWNKTMAIYSTISKQCVRYYENKDGDLKEDFNGYQGMTRRVMFNDQVHSAWSKWYAAKEVCERFWESDDGVNLDTMNQTVKFCWEQIEDMGLENKRSLYFRLLNETFNDWSIWGEVDPSCDKPSLKDSDRKGDIPVGLYTQLEGIPNDDDYAVLQYLKAK